MPAGCHAYSEAFSICKKHFSNAPVTSAEIIWGERSISKTYRTQVVVDNREAKPLRPSCTVEETRTSASRIPRTATGMGTRVRMWLDGLDAGEDDGDLGPPCTEHCHRCSNKKPSSSATLLSISCMLPGSTFLLAALAAISYLPSSKMH
eukprot:3387161-Amphidinium_carterae.1